MNDADWDTHHEAEALTPCINCCVAITILLILAIFVIPIAWGILRKIVLGG